MKRVPVHPDLRWFLKRKLDRDLSAHELVDPEVIRGLVLDHSRDFVRSAIEGKIHGVPWSGPPFDLEMLASLLGHRVEESRTIFSEDAELHPNLDDPGTYIIYVHPDRHTNRKNFSIAHELGHTVFSPADGSVRARRQSPDTALQFLEDMCDLVASELLLPYESFRKLADSFGGVSLQTMRELSNTFCASPEAVANRMVKLSATPCAVAILQLKNKPVELKNRRQGILFPVEPPKKKLRVNYCVTAPGFDIYLPDDKSVEDDSPLYSVYEAGEDFIGAVRFTLKSRPVTFHTEASLLPGGQAADRVLLFLWPKPE
ncbi:MAG: ImmA/IrrE family metallo-endopeptidase [Candidatus Eremiobacteraeota bacterium]|nr:ImmA/IrrE family metallo-endopeptidase [Candidatus Eremiobacteraeota bacterium]